RLYTLLPPSISKKEILRLVPEATAYMIDQTRKLKRKGGVWATPDAYMGKKANAEDVRVALEYYRRDDLACSIPSPNKKDVVKAMINDNKTKVVKRLMTRSIKEAYRLFRKDHPHRELGISKFNSLRPKWVKKSPEHEVCACIYCVNFQLLLTAITNASQETFTEDDFKRIYLCSAPQNDCFLRRCEKCPKMQSISLQSLHLEDEDEDICYALWDAGELVKKVMDTSAFLKGTG
ncbi:hypothetical protein ISCGN_006183, partial [Ixodes scapularis]